MKLTKKIVIKKIYNRQYNYWSTNVCITDEELVPILLRSKNKRTINRIASCETAYDLFGVNYDKAISDLGIDEPLDINHFLNYARSNFPQRYSKIQSFINNNINKDFKKQYEEYIRRKKTTKIRILYDVLKLNISGETIFESDYYCFIYRIIDTKNTIVIEFGLRNDYMIIYKNRGVNIFDIIMHLVKYIRASKYTSSELLSSMLCFLHDVLFKYKHILSDRLLLELVYALIVMLI